MDMGRVLLCPIYNANWKLGLHLFFFKDPKHLNAGTYSKDAVLTFSVQINTLAGRCIIVIRNARR